MCRSDLSRMIVYCYISIYMIIAVNVGWSEGQITATDGNSTTPSPLYYEPPHIADYPRATLPPTEWSYVPAPPQTTLNPPSTQTPATFTCPPCNATCPPPATHCYGVTEPVLNITVNDTSASPYTTLSIIPYPANCSSGQQACTILDPFLNFGQPYQQCYDATQYRCTPNGVLCPMANPQACGLTCFKAGHRYQCSVNKLSWWESRLVFNGTLENTDSPFIFCPSTEALGSPNPLYTKSTCSAIDSPIGVKRAPNQDTLLQQCTSMYVDGIQQQGCVVYNPYVNNGQAYVQCYNEHEYVCNDNQFLCPISTPWVCGTTCFSLRESRCALNGTDFYSSILIPAYLVPDSSPYLLCNRQATQQLQGVEAQIVLNPVGKQTGSFSPYPIKIQVGQTVIWKNNDVTTHTISSADPADGSWNKVFESGDVNPGDRYALTFASPGEYYYGCRYTGFRRMSGLVQVSS